MLNESTSKFSSVIGYEELFRDSPFDILDHIDPLLVHANNFNRRTLYFNGGGLYIFARRRWSQLYSRQR